MTGRRRPGKGTIAPRPNRCRAPSSHNRRKIISPSLIAQAPRTIANARCCARRPSGVRIDVGGRAANSRPVEFCASRRGHEPRSTRKEWGGAVAVCSVHFASWGTESDSIRPAPHLHDRRSMRGDRLGTHEALRAHRSWTSCYDNRGAPAIGGGAFTSVTP